MVTSIDFWPVFLADTTLGETPSLAKSEVPLAIISISSWPFQSLRLPTLAVAISGCPESCPVIIYFTVNASSGLISPWVNIT